jgi:hypothetical protein
MKKMASFLIILGMVILISDPAAAGIPGDVNDDKKVDIADAILALQVMSQSSPGQIAAGADIDGDNRIGMAEVFYVLQGVAEQRVLPSIIAIKAVSGQITLPAGVPVTITDLTVLNSAGEVHPGAQGSFTVDALDGGAALHTVLSPAGNVMLLGWLDDHSTSISPRTTAEVMLFFALGADRYPTEEREEVRRLLSMADEVAPLAEAIATELQGNADAFAGENAAVTAAMTGVIDKISASASTTASATSISAGAGRQALALSVEPSAKKSGVTILPEGVNKIRLSNEYRRRLKVWIDQIAYVPQGGGAWVQAKLPLTEFEVDPVKGLKSVNATVIDWFNRELGGSAYTPVSSDPISLPVMPKTAEKTAYEVIVCGKGSSDGDLSLLPSDRWAGYAETEVNFLFYDIIMPAIINIIVPNAKVPEILKKLQVKKADISMFIKTLMASPALMKQISNGDISGAIVTIKTIETDTYKGAILKDFLNNMLTITGVNPANATRAGQIVDGFLSSMKVMNAALTAVDIKVIETHGLLSKKMETWRVEVSRPKVVLTPELAIVLPEGTQDFSATLPEATGDGAPALTYHWKNSGTYGTMTDNIHTGTEFDSSHSTVTYTGASIGTDTIEVEAFEVQGQGRVSVGTSSATVAVASAKVSVEKPLIDVAQGKFAFLKGIVEPAPTANQEIWYEWSSACAYGRFNGGNPFRDKSNQLTYMAGTEGEGEDVVTLTVYRVLGDWYTGSRTVLGQAQVRVRVWKSPKKSPLTFYTYGPRIVDHAYKAPGSNITQTRWLIYGWAYSWPTPEGMHKSGTPTVPTTVNQTLPLQWRYDAAYKMGLDLRKEIGIPDDVNFETRISAEHIGFNTDIYSLYYLRDQIEAAKKLLNSLNANWQAATAVNPSYIDCAP